jgi:hypothetical protein
MGASARLATRRGAETKSRASESQIGNPEPALASTRDRGAVSSRKGRHAQVPSRVGKGRPWVAFGATGTQCFNSPEERRQREGSSGWLLHSYCRPGRYQDSTSQWVM